MNPQEKTTMEHGMTPDLIMRFIMNDPDTPLTDDELDRVGQFYYNLETMLSVLGRDFYLARQEVIRRLTRARQLSDERKKNAIPSNSRFSVSRGTDA